MPPRKAKLHSSTGKLKTINKAYSGPSGPPSFGSSFGSSSGRAPVTSTQTEIQQQPPPPQNSIVAAPPTHDSGADQQFELELCWCIQSMEKTLEAGNLTAKQAADTEKTIKLLKSHNQPIIRKRQIMRTAFGDYRSKMEDEEKKLRLGSRQIQFVDSISNKSEAKPKAHFVKKSWTNTLGEKNFKFDFPVPDLDKLKLNDSAGTDADAADAETTESQIVSQIQSKSLEQPPSASIQKPTTFTSDNSFRFNFSADN